MKQYLIFLLGLLLVSSCSLSDYNEDLGNGFYLIHEGAQDNVISRELYKVGDPFIPCNVIDYKYNKEFIVAIQQPTKDCFFGVDKNEYGQEKFYYWIIDKNKNLIHGPLKKQDYLQRRVELNIPSALKFSHW